jgi:2-dehydro-3-deoxygluconokinase
VTVIPEHGATSSTEAPSVVTFGETMALMTAASIGPLRFARTFELGIGGAEANVAIGLRRLGIRTAWCGCLGDDEFGRLILERLRAEEVDTSAIRITTDAPTGLMIKERRSHARTRVLYYRRGSAGAAITPSDVPEALVSGADVVHLTGITPALSASARETVEHVLALAGLARTRISVDLNHRAQLWESRDARPTFRRLWEAADVLFATAAEAELVTDEADPRKSAAILSRGGACEALVKVGADGAIAHVGGELLEADAKEAEMVDPVGAGDAFACGYLFGSLQGLPPRERLGLAVTLGSFAVSVPGDIEGLPTLEELESLTGDEDVLR